ncbi:MAG: M48 family metallopeptidase [Deltaproteobacteria bacterium]|jgi:predicted Zn-dependent protease|nr:M48 family metallopeptidase [Deltaproteobacteria bacterium]
MFRQTLSVILALGLLCLASACAHVVGTQRSQLSLVPESELLPLAAREYQRILAQEKISTDSQKTQMVKRVGARIQLAAEKYLTMFGRSSEKYYYHWEFNLLDSPKVNAFCLPGGKVAVYEGILPIAQNEAGLATVMAHEVAHALAHHGSERMSQNLLRNLGGQALDIGLSSRGVSSGTARAFLTAYGLGSQFGILFPFSRTQEAEADRIGLSLMAMAGYEPEEALKFWGRMGQASQRSRATAEFLSTHPSDQSRIANLKAFLGEAKSRFVPDHDPADQGTEVKGRPQKPRRNRPQKN